MRISKDPRFTPLPLTATASERNLRIRLEEMLRDIANQLNNLTEGRIAAITNSTTSFPTAGTYNQGDFVKNSVPTELGTAGNKYTLDGWRCVASGTPGTWVEVRTLTGN